MPETARSETNRPAGPLGTLRLLGPGILVAATGVGAGDLATGAFTGHRLGVTVLWAVLIGAAMKFLLNEGLARWQLATGDTLLEGVATHFGKWALWLFLAYMAVWTLWVGTALMSACGVAAHAMLPWQSAERDKVVYGVLHSGAAVLLVRLGGYRWFERVMSVCIGVMFVTVLITIVAIRPDWGAILRGLTIPRIPSADGQGLSWTVALMGGVGGTLTVLCYGYWIREERREGMQWLTPCRWDLASGYLMTALFGIAMVVLGSRLTDLQGRGASLIVFLANDLQQQLGSGMKWAFLIGAWGAVASSLLGVWQSVPYLFADVVRLLNKPAKQHAERSDAERSDAEHSEHGDAEHDVASKPIDTNGRPYLIYLALMAVLPAGGLMVPFESVQKIYAIIGAAFIPLLAAALLALNRRAALGSARNGLLATVALAATMLFFILAGAWELR